MTEIPPKEGIRIRPARLEDHPGLDRIYAELDEHHRRQAPWMFLTPGCDPRPPEHLSRVLADPDHELLVAERRLSSAGGPSPTEILGLAELLQRRRPGFPVFRQADYALIDTIAVRLDVRRCGVGRQLFRACVERAGERGLDRIELNVYEFNSEALAFYEAMGFQTHSRRLIGRTDELGPAEEPAR